eukprot:m.89603 g.89603  ORF g.89603 m.89603 type:complete len:279 (-) comp26314_c0_seq1:178-1014(-)
MQNSTSRMMHPHANEANDLAPNGLRCQRMLDGTNCDAPQQSRLQNRRAALGSSPTPPHQSLDDMERFYAQFESAQQTSPDEWFTEDHTQFFENIEDIQEIADAITAVGITPKGSDILEEQGPKSSRLTRRQATAERRISTASENSQMDDVLALLNSEIPQRPRSPRLSSPRTRSPSMHSPTPRTRSPTRGSPTVMSPTRVRSPKPARRMSTDQENMPTTPKAGRKSFDVHSPMPTDFKELPSKRASVGSRRNSIDAGNASFPLSPTTNERRFSDLSIF